MDARPTPISTEALSARLSAAGFQTFPIVNGEPGEVVYELAHHRDSRYVVRVHSSLQRSDAEVRERGEGSVSVVALLLTPPDVVFNGPAVNRSGTVNEVLDRVVESAREAYAAVNRHRLRASLTAQAREVAVRAKRSDLLRRSG